MEINTEIGKSSELTYNEYDILKLMWLIQNNAGKKIITLSALLEKNAENQWCMNVSMYIHKLGKEY